MQPGMCKIAWVGEIMQLTPPPNIELAHEQRQTFIAVTKECKLGFRSETFESLVKNILKENNIRQEPISISKNSCSFTIKLLEDESHRLSQSELILSINQDHKLTIP